jgi:hypothetical protein
MGASYSFICCGVLGGALTYPDNELIPPIIRERNYPEKLKLFGAIALAGLVCFFIFYASCNWSLDYCGFRGVSSGGMWVMAMLAGLLLGAGIVGVIYTYLNRSDDFGPMGSGNYNPMVTQPAISMI